jgi:hypothetical protein
MLVVLVSHGGQRVKGVCVEAGEHSRFVRMSKIIMGKLKSFGLHVVGTYRLVTPPYLEGRDATHIVVRYVHRQQSLSLAIFEIMLAGPGPISLKAACWPTNLLKSYSGQSSVSTPGNAGSFLGRYLAGPAARRGARLVFALPFLHN